MAGSATEFDVDAVVGTSNRVGLRLRFIGLLPGILEAHVGVGVRHLFLAGNPLSPFLGASVAFVGGNECVADVCGFPGVGASAEGGVEWRLGDRARLWAWIAVFAKTASSPPGTPMPSLWLGLGW